jgi:hypothetical protein
MTTLNRQLRMALHTGTELFREAAMSTLTLEQLARQHNFTPNIRRGEFEHYSHSAIADAALRPSRNFFHFFLESQPYHEPADRSRYYPLYTRFESLHAELASELRAEFGPPRFSGRYGTPGYPVALTGSDHVALWHLGRCYLSLETDLASYHDAFNVEVFIGFVEDVTW